MLTNSEKQVLDYITKFKTTNGYSPTIKEISQNTYRSQSAVVYNLECLKDKQYIRYKERQARTIVVQKFRDD